MTNSEKQTKNMAKGRGQKSAIPKAQVASSGEESSDTNSSEVEVPAYATRGFWQSVLLVLLVMGMVFSLHINSWHFTVPVVILWLGWAGVLATVGLIWEAGLSIAGEGSGDRMMELDVSESRRHELEAEKKSLIQAIKEIEFDRDLGKMSEEDATEMMKFYRARAIEVIKELDGQLDEELSVGDRVKRDLEARLAVAGQGRKRPLMVSGAKKTSSAKKPETASEEEPAETDSAGDDVKDGDAKAAAEDTEDAVAKSDESSSDSSDATSSDSETTSTEATSTKATSTDPDDEADTSADSNVKESA